MTRLPQKTFLLSACLLLATAPRLVLAQEPLSLDAALELARNQNELPQIALARRARARGLTREAWARVLPQALLQGSYTRRSQEVSRGEDLIANRNALGATATLQTSLIDASAIPLIMSARRSEAAEAHDAISLVQGLAYDVATTFFSALSAEELLQAAERRVVVAQAALDVAKRRLEAGLVGAQDVTRTELSVSNARLARNDARVAVRVSRLALGELLNTDLADRPLATPADVPPPPDAQATVDERPDLLALEEDARAAELLSVEPWLRLVPSLDVGAAVNTTNEPGFSGEPTTWRLFAQASWSLYDGGLRYAHAQQRAAQARELRLTHQARRRSAVREAAEAEVRVLAAREAVEEALTAQRVARANMDEVARLFAAGLATALERDDATVAAFEADSELARKRFDLRVARLEERRARGLWPLEETQ